MITIEAVTDQEGVLRSCKASGHAGAGKAGDDMVCAAVSVLAGTAFRVLPGREGIIIRGGAPEPGLFWIEADYTAGGRDFLFAAGEYLLTGLRFVAEEFPEYCTMTIRSERRT